MEAFNINNAPGKLGKKIHIGKGTINLKTAIPKFNKVVSISIAMTHTSKKGVFRKGRIEMDGLIEVQENQVRLNSVKQTMNFVGLGLASSIGLGNDGKRLRVTVNSMKALNLVDTGSRLDPQDPALWIKIGDSYNMTARQQDARCNATFDELYQYEVSGEAYDTGVEVGVLTNLVTSLTTYLLLLFV